MPDINTDKVCFVIVKARELESEDEGLENDASNATDDKFVSVMTDDAYKSVRAKLAAFIDAMDKEEQSALVALSWIGRGEFAARRMAARGLQGADAAPIALTSEYLLENPLLASHLEYGLAEFGDSFETFAPTPRR